MKQNRHTGNRKTHEAGFTLLEALAVVAVMGICLSLFLHLFTSASRLSLVNARAFARIQVTEALQQEFSEAVRLATGVSSGVGKYRTSENTLVLSLPDDQFIVIGRDMESRYCFRLDLNKTRNGIEAVRFSRYPLPLAGMRIEYDTADPLSTKLVTLHAEVAGDGEKQPARPWIILASAALRYTGAGTPGDAADE